MRRLGLHLTDRCQLDCAHCLRDPGRKPTDLDLAVITAVLRDATELGITRVSMTGGEPSLHPRFAEVLDAVVAHRMTWDMVTNGHRFDRVLAELDEVPARRDACAQLVFSLDGATDAVHDAIRGSGNRREVLASIALATVHDIPFGVQMTVHAGNADEIESLGLEAALLGARHVSFAMMQPTGTFFDAALAMAPDAWRAVYQRIERLASVLRVPVIATEGWPDGSGDRCGPLRGETVHIDVHGRLTLCCLHSGIPGSNDARDVVGDARAGLIALGASLDALIERTVRASAMVEPAEQGIDPWRDFGCNRCLARAGKPHWSRDGVAGALAERRRWRGAWQKDSLAQRERPRLKVLPS